ncbi:MAG: C-type lectin domain-containing protein [Sandaracinus sp.]
MVLRFVALALVALLAISASACTAIRPLDPWEAGSPGLDAAGIDAARADASMDAALPPEDAALGDAAAVDAARVDAARVDAFVPTDGGCGDALVVYYPDADGDGYGDVGLPIPSCVGPPVGMRTIPRGGDCNDLVSQIHPGANETCNGLDDDCDGTIDDGVTRCGAGGFGCQVRAYGGHSYALCPTVLRRVDAETECESFGYHLVVIDDAAENTFVQGQAQMVGVLGSYVWIGLSTMPLAWEGGMAPGYMAWEPAEPNGTGTCVRMRATSGLWSDAACADRYAYVCEAP